MRVLIADDTLLMRSMLSEWVESFGYDVTLARDGEVALAKLKGEPIDIALIDWEMPGHNGVEVCWNLRATGNGGYIYVILMTANEEPNRLIQALDSGADDFIRKPVDKAALMARIRAAARVITMQRELQRLAHTDPLTGVRNRRAFMERAQTEMAHARQSGSPLSVLGTDLDHFKKINDTYGHSAGDEALKAFCAICARTLRPTDVVGRLGGEEFGVLLPNADLSLALKVGERLRAAVEAAELAHGGVRFRMTVSIGAAEVRPDAASITGPLSAADEALYRAKEAGRNRVEPERPEGTA